MIRRFFQYTPEIASTAFIDPSAVVIGDVRLAEEVSIWPLTTIRGDIHHIAIGACTNIQDNSVLHVTHKSEFAPEGFGVTIGARVTVGHRVVLHGCTIEDECLIGMGSVVLDGAVIQARTLVGAGSLVPPGKVLEGGFLWMGSPVKKIRPLTVQELRYFNYSAQHYVELKNRHQQALSG